LNVCLVFVIFSVAENLLLFNPQQTQSQPLLAIVHLRNNIFGKYNVYLSALLLPKPSRRRQSNRIKRNRKYFHIDIVSIKIDLRVYCFFGLKQFSIHTTPIVPVRVFFFICQKHQGKSAFRLLDA